MLTITEFRMYSNVTIRKPGFVNSPAKPTTLQHTHDCAWTNQHCSTQVCNWVALFHRRNDMLSGQPQFHACDNKCKVWGGTKLMDSLERTGTTLASDYHTVPAHAKKV